ncbi:putative PC-Esterase [Lupinus albus]|uniref:Putative PC-Esterase n=1 Tax=Lupinus albus TaxID=3870 RepID=A0A6A4R6B9_LUPAL|nr:putative PC-Esterase [Lupinus albus]
MFIGDSLSRNQWQSLTCMLHSSVPNSNYTLDRVGDVSIFTFTVGITILLIINILIIIC